MMEMRIDAGAAQGRVWRTRIDEPGARAIGRRTRSASATDHRASSAPLATATPVVSVVDDDVSVRESLEVLTRTAGWRVQTFASAEEFVARPRVHAPSCLILDVSLPGLDGLDLPKRIAADRRDMPIIFVAGHADVPMSVQAMKAGALEFLMKPLRDDVLLSAIAHALERSETALCEEAQAGALRDRHASLSRREREVMALVVAGLLNKQVASELGISEITVKAHRGKVMQKMNADSFATLVTMATRLGLVPVPNGCAPAERNRFATEPREVARPAWTRGPHAFRSA
jgi:FixJ family two-component response regulator